MSTDAVPPPPEQAALIKTSLGWRGIMLAHVGLIAWIAVTAHYAWK